MIEPKCRFCNEVLTHTFVDLGMSPLSNAYIPRNALLQVEPFYPLHAFVCSRCFLVQLPAMETSENIFSDYLYFSSFSDSWLAHSKAYTQKVIDRFEYDSNSLIVELASNDGYLLQYFIEKKIPVLGVEPAKNVAKVAIEAGIPTIVKFFSEQTATELFEEGRCADLLIGNNVLAHVPDINDFVRGMKIILKPNGVITMEFPHLMRLMEENQFDTIYHEHFSYFSFMCVDRIFREHGLKVFDVDELPTHGGSLRIYACHAEDKDKTAETSVALLRQRELSAGYNGLDHYMSFAPKVKKTKQDILSFLIEQKQAGKTLVGYGAAAKGNTLMNYCGIRNDFIDFTVDRNPHKQGHFLPGTRIPIFHPDKILEEKPDYVIILPWNIKNEIIEQMVHVRKWGGEFVTLIPEVQTYP